MYSAAPSGFLEWMGYLLFHDFIELNFVGVVGLVILGFVAGQIAPGGKP